MASQRSTLVGKLRALAEDAGHPRAAELKRCADELRAAIDGYDGSPASAVPVHHLVHCWSRARHLWQECAGADARLLEAEVAA